ncbi:MFS transporter [Desertihabitans brevis]|uniref:MFS transporter n=2 Tax=Desertihabitans brevis TaxID=2268447 RepID=A0A367YTI6_9ACTN|nr:MFS transporter [Desertihabitans brevis]
MAGLPDRRLARATWPLLVAAVVGLLPFTVYSTFLVPIAEAVHSDEATVGALRGLGGVAALLTGVAVGPLLGHWSRPRTVAAALGLLAVTCLVGSVGTLPAVVAFCFGTGVATAVLTPALLTAATSRFPDRADGGRAATVLTATQSLAAVLAGPVIGVLALWRGWTGVLWATAALAVVVALVVLLREPAATGAREASPGYRKAFGRLRGRPELLALVAVAGLRTASFMGYLSFLAASYHDRFGTDAGTFTLIWTLSGASFFTGNLLAGRGARGWVAAGRARRVLALGLGGALVAVLLVFSVGSLPLALAATVLMGLSHAVVAAMVTTVVARDAGDLTATAFSLTAAAMSAGVFLGGLVGGIGLGLAGDLGLSAALAIPTVVAVVLVPVAGRASRPDAGRSPR